MFEDLIHKYENLEVIELSDTVFEGSSRIFVLLPENYSLLIDDKPSKIPTGVKIVKLSHLDPYHEGDEQLGVMQNRSECGDQLINSKYRIILKQNGGFVLNEEFGIFPPLIDFDEQDFKWCQVGYCKQITKEEFVEFTKEEKYPDGISHNHFFEALNRNNAINDGKYTPKSLEKEKAIDDVENHSLVIKFYKYKKESHSYIGDIKLDNFGVYEHINGKKYIVCIDHGYTEDVKKAYRNARKNRSKHEDEDQI